VVLGTHWKLAPGEQHPWAGRERLNSYMSTLHDWRSADVNTGCLKVLVLSIGPQHSITCFCANPSMESYFIFSLDSAALHRDTQCVLKSDASAQKLGSIS